MECHEMVSASYEGVMNTLERVLQGLSEEELNYQPKPDCNSIGWLAWHLTRVQDAIISMIMGEEQLWTKDGWCAKFGRPADAQDNGAGHTPQDLAAFKVPDAKTLLDYHRAVLERSQRYLPTISPADMDRELTEPPFLPPQKLGMRLMLIADDSLQHAGQAAYVRGLCQGKGWQPF